MPPVRGFEFSNEPSPEAREFFRNKGLRPSFDWRDVWAQEHAFAFTVAKATQMEVLITIRRAVDAALAKGLTFEDFSKQLGPRLQKMGWWGRQIVTDPLTGEDVIAQLGSPQRLRLIYDANLRSANAAGQWDRAQRTKAVLPFLLYVETISREPREEHLAQVGTIAEIDDPYWDTWFPPNGYGCKCSARQMTRSEAQKRGWRKGSKAPEWETRPFLNKRTGVIEDVPVGIDPGWHVNPAKARFSTLDQLLSGKLDDLAPELRAVAVKDMTSNWLFRRVADGEFYDIKAPAHTPDIAIPVVYLDKALRKLTSRPSGVVWMTPDKPFVFGKPSPDMWGHLARVVDEGAIVRHQKDAGYLTFYREIDKTMYRAEIGVRDATPLGTPIKGGRLELRYYREMEPEVARQEQMIADGEGRLVRTEASKRRTDGPAFVPIQAIPELAPVAFPPGERQTIILDDGTRVDARHLKGRGKAPARRIELSIGKQKIGQIDYELREVSGRYSEFTVQYVYVEPRYRRKGLATQLYDRLEAWAQSESIAFGPAEDLMDDGFVFWQARRPDHPRVLADARHYKDALLAYGRKRHGAGVQIDVELDGRTVYFIKGPQVVENVTFEALTEAGILPQFPRYKRGGGGAP